MSLEPGQRCLYCGSVGKPPPAEHEHDCPLCYGPFRRGQSTIRIGPRQVRVHSKCLAPSVCKLKDACPTCGQGFDRSRKWRRYRGKRMHVDCIPSAIVPHEVKKKRKSKTQRP